MGLMHSEGDEPLAFERALEAMVDVSLLTWPQKPCHGHAGAQLKLPSPCRADMNLACLKHSRE